MILDARGRSPLCGQVACPLLGGEAGGRSPGFIFPRRSIAPRAFALATPGPTFGREQSQVALALAFKPSTDVRNGKALAPRRREGRTQAIAAVTRETSGPDKSHSQPAEM